MAILLAMDRREAEALVERVLQQLELAGRGTNVYRKLWLQCKIAGFSSNYGEAVPGVHTIAVPIFDANHIAFASLAMVGEPRQLLPEHKEKLLLTLQAVATETQDLKSAQKRSSIIAAC